jgi:hypothetical protein
MRKGWYVVEPSFADARDQLRATHAPLEACASSKVVPGPGRESPFDVQCEISQDFFNHVRVRLSSAHLLIDPPVAISFFQWQIGDPFFRAQSGGA